MLRLVKSWPPTPSCWWGVIKQRRSCFEIASYHLYPRYSGPPLVPIAQVPRVSKGDPGQSKSETQLLCQLSSHKKKLDRLQQEKGYLQEVINDEHNPRDFVSGSKIMRRVLEQIRMVAHADTPVLLLGETGTGKELLARSIHEFSDRSASIMVKINARSCLRN